MKVATLHGPGDLRMDDEQRPTCGAGDVVVKVAAAGICGTDIHFRAMGTRYGRPMPLGHEFAGEILLNSSRPRRASPNVPAFTRTSPSEVVTR